MHKEFNSEYVQNPTEMKQIYMYFVFSMQSAQTQNAASFGFVDFMQIALYAYLNMLNRSEQHGSA